MERKNRVANLPNDFDSSYWGINNIVSPAAELNNIIAAISKGTRICRTLQVWKAGNISKTYNLATKKGDSIKPIRLVKCAGDRETGGMIYKKYEN